MSKVRIIIAVLALTSCFFFMEDSSAETISYDWAANEMSVAEEIGLLKDIDLTFENGKPIPAKDLEKLFQTLTEIIENKTGQHFEWSIEYLNENEEYVTRGTTFLFLLDYISSITENEIVYPSWYPFADEDLKYEEKLAARFLFSRGIVKGERIQEEIPQKSEIWLFPQRELTYTEAVLLALRVYQCAPDFPQRDNYPQILSIEEVKGIYTEHSYLFERIKDEIFPLETYAFIRLSGNRIVATLDSNTSDTVFLENKDLEQFFSLYPHGNILINGGYISFRLMSFPLLQQITYYPDSYDLNSDKYNFVEQYSFSENWKYEYVLPPD